MHNKSRLRSSDIITSNSRTAIMAGIIVKCLFRSRLICVIHDTDFYDIGLVNSIFPSKVYFTMFVRCLRYIDKIITVSQKTQRDLSRFCDANRIILLWGNIENLPNGFQTHSRHLICSSDSAQNHTLERSCNSSDAPLFVAHQSNRMFSLQSTKPHEDARYGFT